MESPSIPESVYPLKKAQEQLEQQAVTIKELQEIIFEKN